MPTRTENVGTGGYRAADQRNTFEYDTGVIAVPLAGREAAHRLIRLHGGIGHRTMRYRFVREGKPPIVPTFEDTSGDTFLGGSISPACPMPSATGTDYDWIVEGVHEYVQNAPRIVGEDAIPVGQHPFTDLGQAQKALDHARYAPSAIGAYLSSSPAPNRTKFHHFIEAVAEATPVVVGGEYSWPLLGLPTIFTSSHITQD